MAFNVSAYSCGFAGQIEVMRETNVDALFLLLVKAANRDLVVRFTNGGVEFVVIGSSAMAFYHLREVSNVGDLDLLLNDTMDNARRVMTVLTSAGVFIDAVAEQLARPYAQIKLKNGTQYWADLLTPPEEVSFNQVFAHAASATRGGLTLKIASIESLRQMNEIAIRSGGDETAKRCADLDLLRNA